MPVQFLIQHSPARGKELHCHTAGFATAPTVRELIEAAKAQFPQAAFTTLHVVSVAKGHTMMWEDKSRIEQVLRDIYGERAYTDEQRGKAEAFVKEADGKADETE